MGKAHWLRDFVVGFVFLGGLGIIGYTTLWLEGMPWNQAYALEVRFPNVDNLKRGEPVLMRGVPIGQVQRITWSPDPTGGDDNVLVIVSLQRNVAGALTRNAQFFIRSAGPLGGRQLEIDPGDGDIIDVNAAPRFSGEADGDIFRQLAEFVRENRGPFKELVASLNTAADDLEVVMSDVRNGTGLIGELIKNEQLATDAKSFMSRANEIVTDVTEKKGPLGALVSDEEWKKEIGSFVDGLDNPDGIVAMLLHDKGAKDDLRSFISSAKKVTDDLGEGNGLLQRLMKDEELADTVSDTFTSIGKMSDDLGGIIDEVQTGNGTLHQLIYDEEGWKEIMRILVLARESIEDLREQAPINTFTNVIFSAF